jgi:hypothetical protein
MKQSTINAHHLQSYPVDQKLQYGFGFDVWPWIKY